MEIVGFIVIALILIIVPVIVSALTGGKKSAQQFAGGCTGVIVGIFLMAWASDKLDTYFITKDDKLGYTSVKWLAILLLVISVVDFVLGFQSLKQEKMDEEQQRRKRQQEFWKKPSGKAVPGEFIPTWKRIEQEQQAQALSEAKPAEDAPDSKLPVFCYHCGARLPKQDAAFCSNCGTKL